jgi:hypothetical protein
VPKEPLPIFVIGFFGKLPLKPENSKIEKKLQ